MLSKSSVLFTLALAFFANSAKAEMEKATRASTATVYENCKVSGTFALTFDDGPYDYEDDIATRLQESEAIGTFFFNGNNWDCIYDRAEEVRAAYDAGMLIGTHTWSHPDLTTLSTTEIKQQFDLVETAFKKILGIKPRFFRPPYGSYNTNVLTIAKQYGYEVIIWNVDTEDADGATVAYSEEQYTDYVKSPGYPTPGLALNHSPYSTTAHKVTGQAIKTLQAAGYKLVSVAECLGFSQSEWYQSVGSPSARDSTWTCDGTPAGK